MTSAHGDTEPVTDWFRLLIAELLGADEEEIPLDRPLGELGMDSLTAAELSATVEERVGALISLERFLGDETVEQVVAELGSHTAVATTEEAGA
ncbi:acyl carrier protein [Streptomyces anthocyanicus]|uniref:acyl carrier protein n=1 Tax=Streptomyces anthocyanicus TaxID=68174 RepID=UPI001670D0A7|nr:acyl carrier protein [Streptomyces anthocyanicus]